MYSNNTDFYSLVSQANKLQEMSKFAEAAVLYERALLKNESREEELQTKYGLSVSLSVAGYLTEALSYASEVYAATYDDKKFSSLAFVSLLRQINILQKIHKFKSDLPCGNPLKIFDLIENGIKWLNDLGGERLKSGLLLEKAEMLFTIGKEEAALEVAEESYKLKKAYDDGGFYLGDHCRKVAKFARILGDYERGLHVLDEMDDFNSLSSPLCNAKLIRERVAVLNSWIPSRSIEALSTAKDMIHYAGKIQGTKHIYSLYMVYADAALCANSLSEAIDTFWKAKQIVFKDDAYYRFPLLVRLKNSLIESKNALIQEKDALAIRYFCKTLDGYIEEIDQELKRNSGK